MNDQPISECEDPRCKQPVVWAKAGLQLARTAFNPEPGFDGDHRMLTIEGADLPTAIKVTTAAAAFGRRLYAKHATTCKAARRSSASSDRRRAVN